MKIRTISILGLATAGLLISLGTAGVYASWTASDKKPSKSSESVSSGRINGLIDSATSGSRNVLRPSSNIITREEKLGEISHVEVSGIVNVVYVQSSGAPHYTLSAPDNLIQYVKIMEKGNGLYLNTEYSNRGLSLEGDANITVTIYTSKLTEFNLSGATSLTCAKLVSPTGKFELEASGAAHINIADIALNQLEVELSGAASLRSKTINTEMEAEFDLSGAAKVNVANLKTRRLEVDASGASSADLQAIAAEDVSAEVSGAAKVKLKGSATKVDYEVMGASHLTADGLKADMGSVEVGGASHATVSIKSPTKMQHSGTSHLTMK